MANAQRYAYDVETQTPGISDESLQDARALLGVDLRRDRFRWATETHPDQIKHFCWAVSDENPLWMDAAHGAASRYGRNVAPPTFLYCIDRGHVAPGLRGVQWIYVGADWDFYRPVLTGEKLTSRARLIDAHEVEGKNARRMILQIGEVNYYVAETGEEVGRAHTKIMRIPRAKASGGLNYQPREPHRYSPEDLEAIEDAIDGEEIRGAVPRYWEDVKEGDSTGQLVKGPLNASDMAQFYAGIGCFYLSFEMAHKLRRRHPAEAYLDTKTGAQDHPARGHQEKEMAHEVGMPGPYDSGLQRICFMSQLMTNWIGDDAQLLDLKVKLKKPNIFGDTQWCRGKVVAKRVDEVTRRHVVECELWADNQIGERTVVATATAALPSRTTV